MEKIKFTVQIVMLVLALPVWFFAEMKRTDKAMKTQQINRVDSIPVKRELSFNAAKTAYFPELPPVSLEEAMLVCN